MLPLAVATFTLVGTVNAARGQPAARPLDALGVALLLLGPALLVVRRRHPPAVLAAIALVACAYLLLGYPFGPVFLAGIVAMCSAVLTGHRLGAYAVTAGAFAVLLVVHLLRNPDQPPPLFGAGGWLSSLAIVIAVCEWWRARRERLAQLRLAEEEAQRRRGSEERLRIARDLHDALGHHVSLINVQAGVALHLMADDPEQARSALAAIKESSGQLLREMRATLGVLRGVDEDPPRGPVAGLARLDALLAENRAAGLPVGLTVGGTARELPPSVDQAAYRIVQEALTNTRRHAGPRGRPCTSPTTTRASPCSSRTTARARSHRRTCRAAATGCPGCGSAPARSAGLSPRVRATAAGSGCTPGCPRPSTGSYCRGGDGRRRGAFGAVAAVPAAGGRRWRPRS
ncbi:hypothetical protein BJF78_22090 [Pseudonocardia sp. CNS-139]|nr:hypothetical protein BJF78_22090 [Pseudonocardia sp. CNS-139]